MYSIFLNNSVVSKNKGLFLSKDHSYLMDLQENSLSYWQIDNLSIMFESDSLLPGNCLAVSTDEKVVAVAEGNTIFIEENPMQASSTRIVGKNFGSRHKFMNFVIESQKKTSNAIYSEMHNH